jgi:hypothetical protein
MPAIKIFLKMCTNRQESVMAVGRSIRPEQDRKFTYNGTTASIGLTFVAVEKSINSTHSERERV